MATVEITVVDKSGKIVPNVRINASYQSIIGAALGKVGKDYKVYTVKTDTKGQCRFNITKNCYIWFGAVSRELADSINVTTSQTQATLKLSKKIEEYEVTHKFHFIDLNKKSIPAESTQNQLLYRVSRNQGKTWEAYTALTNPLLVKSHVGEVIIVKLYTKADSHDILKETGKNHYTASKYQSLGENFLNNVLVPIRYINAKTDQDQPIKATPQIQSSNKCLSGFTNCPCQTVRFDKEGFLDSPLVDKSERINRNTNLQAPVAILLHRTDGWSATSSIQSGREKSAFAHFYVCSGLNGFKNGKDYRDGVKEKIPSTDGKIYQVLSINKKSNHMGTLPFPATVDANIGNHNTLSIEVAGKYDEKGLLKWPEVSDKQARSVACLLTALMRKYQLGYDKVHFHEDLCTKTDYEGRLVWIGIKKYLKNPPKGPKATPYRIITRIPKAKEGNPSNNPFKILPKYPVEN